MTNTNHIIIYAEDDLDDLYIVQQAFEAFDNISLIHAGNGAEALSTLHSLAATGSLPCLIILDINMPVMDGRETVMKLKSERCFSSLPIVLFTTSNSQADKTFAEQYGVQMITKPLHFKDLQNITMEMVSKCNFGVNSTKSFS
jgi:CheY-like chemotaxis protein